MKFIELDKEYIRNNSELIDDNYYKFVLGNHVEVTVRKRVNMNSLIASNLSSDVHEDSFMLRYRPTNVIYFSQRFILDENEENFASCFIDPKTHSVYIGNYEDFEMKTGVLTMSGFVSLNGKITENKKVLGNAKVTATIMKRIRVLSVGVRDEKLFALYFIPNTRGMAVGLEGGTRGISTTTLKVKDCSSYASFNIEDWFKDCLVKEI